MRKSQIYLSDNTNEYLVLRAQKERKSFAELVREIIESEVSKSKFKEKTLAASLSKLPKVKGLPNDLSANIDNVLYGYKR